MAIAHAHGATVDEQRYYPYGETRLTTGTMYTDKLFTGQREMAGLGIYHYGARFYSPKLARFLSPDLIVAGYANPQNLNPFSYVNNNPLRYIDPTGHMRVQDGGGSDRFPKPNLYGIGLAINHANKSGGYMSTYAVAAIGVQNPTSSGSRTWG